MKNNSFKNHPVVSSEKWLAARNELLREEKEFTRVQDKMNARRRALPWVKVEKNYTFEAPGGACRSLIFSKVTASSSCNISCLVPARTKAARAAPS